MQALLKNLTLNFNNETERANILNGITIGIDNDQKLQDTIGELLPFITDNDRQLRTASMIVLEHINNNFDVKAVKTAILEMATTKLGDSATLFIACKIIKQNLSYASDEYINTVFDSLLSVELRSNLLAHRLEAYSLLEILVANPHLKIEPTQENIHKFHKFCGYEQDPKCLNYIFKLFPVFSERVLPFINDQLRAQLFDVVSVFYPITARPELSQDLCKTLALLPEYTVDLCQLVSTKLTNALADTRSPVFESLPLLLIREAPEQCVGDIVVSFAKSLSDYFVNGSTDASQEVVDEAVKSIVHFVEISKDSHTMLYQSAMSNWIPTIINSTESSTIRAYSIVSWSLDTVLHFSPVALVPLSATAENALNAKEEPRIQAILASMVEFMKFQPVVNKELSDIAGIFNVAVSVLKGDFPQNCVVSALVLLREISARSYFPHSDGIVPFILKFARVQSFAAQLFVSLAERQSHYETPLIEELVDKLTAAIQGGNNEIIGENRPFEKLSEVVAFSSRLCASTFFARYLLPAIARGGFTKELLKCILPLNELNAETCESILEAVNALENPNKNVVLSVAIRAPNGFLISAMFKYSRISDLLLFAARPSEVPNTPPALNSDLAKFAYGAKTSTYCSGFHPPAAALAFRNEITEEFCAEDIPILLEMENFFDGAIGGDFNKFQLLEERFLYNDDYKISLWKPFYKSLNDKPGILCKLCLLCPPDFFQSMLSEFVLLLPAFIENDTKGGLDLTIFALMSLSRRDQIAMISTMAPLVNVVCQVLANGDAYERLDACRVLRALTVQLPTDACQPHKRMVMKALGVALDDDKREVRNEAANARVAWLKIE